MLEMMEWMETEKHWEKNNWIHLNEWTFDFFKKLTKNLKRNAKTIFSTAMVDSLPICFCVTNLCSRHQEKCKYLLSDCLYKI